jgi:3D (Asp-Asp-Asp) domain-containing protein
VSRSLVLTISLVAACSKRPEPVAVRAPQPAVEPVAPLSVASPEDRVARALVFDLPAPDLGAESKRLWATYYYVPIVPHATDGLTLRDMTGKALEARLSRRDWCEAAMQGTVLVDWGDGRRATYNYAGTRDDVEVDCTPVYPHHPAIGRTRYTVATGPYGDGVRDFILVPFRTIAVDPATIPFGSLVYVPAARGSELRLPDGSTAVHDGYFFAADRGGAIKGTHIDVFVGMGKNNPFAFVKSKSEATFDAHVLSEAAAREAYSRLRAGHEAYRTP